MTAQFGAEPEVPPEGKTEGATATARRRKKYILYPAETGNPDKENLKK